MDENRIRLEQPQQDAPKKRSLWPLFFFPMALLYHELLLHAFDRTILFWDTPLVYILLFSAAGGFRCRHWWIFCPGGPPTSSPTPCACSGRC